MKQCNIHNLLSVLSIFTSQHHLILQTFFNLPAIKSLLRILGKFGEEFRSSKFSQLAKIFALSHERL
jgi:hypothetical protein